MQATNQDDADVVGSGVQAAAALEHGTVGWEGDPVVADVGSASNDGSTLVKVTLFRGHDPGAPSSPSGFANGRQILAQLSWPFWIVPPAGMRCFVAFPSGADLETHGAGLIVGCTAASPTKQFSATSAKIDLTGYDLVIKGASVTLISDDGQGTRHMVSVSSQGGCQMADSTGSGFFCKGGEAMMKTLDGSGKLMSSCAATQSALTIVDGAGNGMIKMKGGNLTASGGNCALNYGAIGLGQTASPATPMLVGLTGMAGVGSQSVFGSP